MIVLTGDTGSKKLVKILQERKWGRMCVQKRFTPYDGEPWGFDNGAFIWFRQGLPFQHEVFMKRLKNWYNMGTPYLAVTPDIVCGGMDSLIMSVDYIKYTLNTDWSWYIAVQDGMEPQAVEKELFRFQGIFLGGTVPYKYETAKLWAEMAHRHGKKLHIGRISSKRLELAKQINADSVDGTGLLWEMKKFRSFLQQYDGVNCQETLFNFHS